LLKYNKIYKHVIALKIAEFIALKYDHKNGVSRHHGGQLRALSLEYHSIMISSRGGGSTDAPHPLKYHSIMISRRRGLNWILIMPRGVRASQPS